MVPPAELFPCVLVATDDTFCVYCMACAFSRSSASVVEYNHSRAGPQDASIHRPLLCRTGVVWAWQGRQKKVLASARACCLRRAVRLVDAYILLLCACLSRFVPPASLCCTVLYCSILCTCWWSARFQESVGDQDVSSREESKGKGGKDEDKAAKHVAALARHLTNNWQEMLKAAPAGAGDAHVHVLSPALQPLIQPEQQQKTIVDEEEEADQHAVAATTKVSTMGAVGSSPDSVAKNPGGDGRPEASIPLAPRTLDAAVGDARAELLATKTSAAGGGDGAGMPGRGGSSQVKVGSGTPKIGVTFTYLGGAEKQGYFAVKSLVAQGIVLSPSLPLSLSLSRSLALALSLSLSLSLSRSLPLSLYLSLSKKHQHT